MIDCLYCPKCGRLLPKSTVSCPEDGYTPLIHVTVGSDFNGVEPKEGEDDRP